MNSTSPAHLESFAVKLRDSDSTLDGAIRWIDRHMHRQPDLRRIELRYSNRVANPIGKTEANSRIALLIQQRGLLVGAHGKGTGIAYVDGGPLSENKTVIAVSSSWHELPLDNDAGHTAVRLFFARPEPKTDETGADGGFLSFFRAMFGRGNDKTPDTSSGSVDLLAQKAVDTLLRGIDQAVNRYKQDSAESAVGGVLVTVNAPDLHRLLASKMPPADTVNATCWLVSELAERGLMSDDNLWVTYRFMGPLSDSTDLVSDGDLSVRLMPSGAAKEPAPAPIDPKKRRSAETPMPLPGGDTPLPMPNLAVAAVLPTVHLRVLGTWRGGTLVSFREPFACNLGPVPTQFSRSTLELQGFMRRPDAELARAASDSTPLGFIGDGDGGIQLHAALRPKSTLAMYHFAVDLLPCTGEHPLTGPVRLVVNGPAPLQDGLFPLVIEVSAGA